MQTEKQMQEAKESLAYDAEAVLTLLGRMGPFPIPMVQIGGDGRGLAYAIEGQEEATARLRIPVRFRRIEGGGVRMRVPIDHGGPLTFQFGGDAMDRIADQAYWTNAGGTEDLSPGVADRLDRAGGSLFAHASLVEWRTWVAEAGDLAPQPEGAAA